MTNAEHTTSGLNEAATRVQCYGRKHFDFNKIRCHHWRWFSPLKGLENQFVLWL